MAVSVCASQCVYIAFRLRLQGTLNTVSTGCLADAPITLTAEKYAPNKGYALNKQSYCIYMYYYDEFSVVHHLRSLLMGILKAALNGRKPRRPGRAHAPERDSWASYLQRHLEPLLRQAIVSPSWSLTQSACTSVNNSCHSRHTTLWRATSPLWNSYSSF